MRNPGSQMAGLSYGSSLAYPHRTRSKVVLDHDALSAVLELVHPGQFKVLPPSPDAVITKAWLMGIGDHNDFHHRVWVG